MFTKHHHTNKRNYLALLLVLSSLAACLDESYEDALEEEDDAARIDDTDFPVNQISPPGEDSTVDERAIWSGPHLSSEDRAPFRNGEYDVIALSDSIDDEMLARMHEAASLHDDALLYSVQEERRTQYVVAVPSGAEHVFMEEMLDVLSAPANGIVCNRLYNYYWLGSQFTICGAETSGGHGYTNLGVYGYNNVASSFMVDNTSNLLFMYDGYSYTNFLVELDWDEWSFPAPYNNKASSLYGYY